MNIPNLVKSASGPVVPAEVELFRGLREPYADPEESRGEYERLVNLAVAGQLSSGEAKKFQNLGRRREQFYTTDAAAARDYAGPEGHLVRLHIPPQDLAQLRWTYNNLGKPTQVMTGAADSSLLKQLIADGRWRQHVDPVKQAALRDDVQLQPHQQRIEDMAAESPIRKLLVHSLGSGKSLSGIAAAEALGEPYTAIAPASLRVNYENELDKFTDRKTPSSVMSYSALASGKQPDNHGTLIFDESHNLRNPSSSRAQNAIAAADRAKQVVMLSGTPIVNRPGDLATPIRMLTGKAMTPDEFEGRYVTVKNKYPNLFRRLIGWSSGKELAVNREGELKDLLKGHVDYYDTGKPVVPTTHEDVPVEMSPEQTRIYDAMWDRLPWHVKWKLRNDVALTDAELQRMQSFLTGPRQVGLSTMPYLRDQDPMKAYNQSSKLQEAMRRLQEKLKDDRSKALIFSNFIDAGLIPYNAALQAAKIPAAVFHGGLNDNERRKLVEDYNTGKLRVALLGPSGTEGLSFKGTQLVQLLDPYWNPVRPKQSIGRGLRYDSHFGLPDELKHVQVQRFLSRLPKGFFQRMLGRVGFDKTVGTPATDDHLSTIAANKEELNHKFMELLKDVGTREQEQS